MDVTAVIIGIGEMGGVFARGLLAAGHPVVPVLRHSDVEDLAAATPHPGIALVTVGEDDLDTALETLPDPWRGRVGLIQNELLPYRWTRHGIASPTVAVVWFEKKPGRDVTVLLPTPVAGPAADLVVDALGAIDIPARRIDEDRLLDELVTKNLYILTANIAGLRVGGTVGALWAEHRDLAAAVAAEILQIQRHLTGASLNGDQLLEAMVAAFEADPDHGATGRSAPRRLERALRHASGAGLSVPTLRSIGQDQGLIA